MSISCSEFRANELFSEHSVINTVVCYVQDSSLGRIIERMLHFARLDVREVFSVKALASN
jgi:hypothetical protein